MVEYESSQREPFPTAVLSRDKSGEYTAKIFHGGTRVRELKFSVYSKDWIAKNAWLDQMYFTNFKVAVPVKVMGTVDK